VIAAVLELAASKVQAVAIVGEAIVSTRSLG
jgi:hypothetical protein